MDSAKTESIFFTTELMEYISKPYNGLTKTIAELVGGLNVKVNTNVKMILPFSSKNIDISVMVPLAVKIIQGNIPDYYSSGLNSSLSVPIE